VPAQVDFARVARRVARFDLSARPSASPTFL
jgi:hypothetical protein